MGKPSIDLGEWTQDPSKVVEPSVGKKAEGFNPDEKPAAQYFNWYWKGLLEWAKWLFTVSIDTATSITSFDINKGSNVVNGGTNTTTINCSELSIGSDSSRGCVSDSALVVIDSVVDFDVKNSSVISFNADASNSIGIKNSNDVIVGIAGENSVNINVLNSSSGTVSGSNLSIENSTDFDVKGDNNSIKNCSLVVIPNSINNSSMENVNSAITETKNDTKTLTNIRIMGQKILKMVFDDSPIHSIGNTDQKLFGNRYLSQQAELYWHREVGDWRQSNLLISNTAITGGQQSTDGLFATSVELVDSSDTIEYPIFPSYAETEDQTFSFWSKLKVIDWSGNNGICYDYSYGDAGATFGWVISRSITTGFTFSVQNSNTLYESFMVGIPIKEDVFQHICVVFNFTEKSYSLYIDSEFIGTLYVDSIVGAGTIPLALKIGNVGADTSPIEVKISDVTLWADRMLSPLDIQQVYSGGLELEVATPDLFDNAKITAIQKSTTKEVCVPEYLGVTDDLFVNLRFPDWMKNDNNLSTMTVDVYSEKYTLEDF